MDWFKVIFFISLIIVGYFVFTLPVDIVTDLTVTPDNKLTDKNWGGECWGWKESLINITNYYCNV